MTDNRSRFVLLCQQALACAVVVAVVTPAAGVVTLDFVAPPAVEGPRGTTAEPAGTGATADAAPARVATAPVEPTVTEVPLNARAATDREPAGTQGEDGALARLSSGGETHDEDDGHGHGAVEEPTEEAVSAPTEVEGYATVGVTWNPGERLDEDEVTVAKHSHAKTR